MKILKNRVFLYEKMMELKILKLRNLTDYYVPNIKTLVSDQTPKSVKGFRDRYRIQ